MAVYFKNSYKSDGAVLPLSVKNVGFQQCTPGYRWGAGVRDHYLIHYVAVSYTHLTLPTILRV